jgi:hypothetical protein
MSRFKKLDSLIVSSIRATNPEYEGAPVYAVSQEIDPKSIRSYVRLSKPLGDHLFETVLFHRTSYANRGFYFMLEFVVSHFRHPTQLGPFAKSVALDACLPPGEIEDEMRSWFYGGDWYALGRTLDECQRRIIRIFSFYEPYVLPVLMHEADVLKNEPSLNRALALARTVSSSALSLASDIAGQLKKEELSHPRFSLEFVARDAITLAAEREVTFGGGNATRS